MNRIMVLLGIGIISALLSQSKLLGEMPRGVSSTGNRPNIDAPITWHTTLESGWAESRRRNVPMVIYITSQNCTYCDAMKRDTWCDQAVQRDLADGFVAITLSNEQNSSTLARIPIETYPTTLIGIPKGKIIAKRTGYQPVGEMRQLLFGVADGIRRARVDQ